MRWYHPRQSASMSPDVRSSDQRQADRLGADDSQGISGDGKDEVAGTVRKAVAARAEAVKSVMAGLAAAMSGIGAAITAVAIQAGLWCARRFDGSP